VPPFQVKVVAAGASPVTTEERIEKLERELMATNAALLETKATKRKHLQASLVLALMVAILFFTCNLPIQEIVRARKFVLVDGQGKNCAVLAMATNGPGLTMFNENDKATIRLGMDKEGPSLRLFDTNNVRRIQLNIATDGPLLALFDVNGTNRATLCIGEDGPDLALWGRCGDTFAGMAAFNSGPTMELLDQNGKSIFSIPSPTINSPPSAQTLLPLPLFGPTSSATQLAPPQSYINVGDSTWVTGVMDNGALVKLQDGSLWQVAPIGRVDSNLWLPTTDITVINGDDPSYPYKLINTEDNETVDARLVSQ